MPRIAILGGGIAGLTAAYELEQHRQTGKPLDWHLFEASNRLGGTVSTTRIPTPDGNYILEDGPDGWVTEKPWATELATELGLGPDIIPCNEASRRTLLWLNNQLVPMPNRMRLMVPEDLTTLEISPLFTTEAKQAYAAELTRVTELKSTAPDHDESVASFVRRHFGPEVLTKVAAPLLSGVFGGDVERLSVRAVMPIFVQMEREHGSLIAALQAKAQQRGSKPQIPTFTSLRQGMGSLTEALLAALPPDRLHTGNTAAQLSRAPKGDWLVRFTGTAANTCAIGFVPFDHLFLATPPDITRTLLHPTDPEAAKLIPTETSSALLITFCWPRDLAQSITLPQGFGFLVPATSKLDPQQDPSLLAATFADQKYPHRAPHGAKIIRTFFGSHSANLLATANDQHITQTALNALKTILGPLPVPAPELTTVRHWPRSLPQYEVGHPDRMTELTQRIQQLGSLYLLGNGYHGVGVPDLIRDARRAARNLAESLN